MKTKAFTIVALSLVSLVSLDSFAGQGNNAQSLADTFDRSAGEATERAVLFANTTKIKAYLEQEKSDIRKALEAVDQIALLVQRHPSSPELQLTATTALVEITQRAIPGTQGQNLYFANLWRWYLNNILFKEFYPCKTRVF